MRWCVRASTLTEQGQRGMKLALQAPLRIAPVGGVENRAIGHRLIQRVARVWRKASPGNFNPAFVLAVDEDDFFPVYHR